MKTALIGYTGFVGSNLATQYNFSDLYNSKNIEDIRDKKYELIISAGTSALRWKANQEPDEDWENISYLIDNLEDVSAARFVLISTIDVYPNKSGVDEDTEINESDLNEPYGLHRFKLEEFVRKNFENSTIIRCPQIYGPGVVKGFVYDLIHDNALDFTHKDSQLQFYNTKNFKKDIDFALINSLQLVNFAVEPTSAAEVAKYCRDMNFKTITNNPPLKFDMRSKYAYLYSNQDGYLYNKEETLGQLKEFIQNERQKI
jgi:hypothetical protein